MKKRKFKKRKNVIIIDNSNGSLYDDKQIINTGDDFVRQFVIKCLTTIFAYAFTYSSCQMSSKAVGYGERFRENWKWR